MALDQWLRNEVWALRVSCLTRVALCDEALGSFCAGCESGAADWGVKVSYTGPACPRGWAPHKNWGYQSLGVPHWQHLTHTVTCWCCKNWALSVQLEQESWTGNWKLLPGISWSPSYLPFSFANFSLFPFTVLNYEWQHKNLGKSIFSFFEFPEGCSHRGCRQSEQPRGVGLKIPKPICKGWGAPAWKINSSFLLNCNSCERKQRFCLEVS